MKKIFPFISIFSLFFSLSSFLLFLNQPLERASLAVICYHSFLGRGEISTDFDLSELKNHLEILKKRGYRFVSSSMILNSEIRGDRNVLVTIDDGNKSVYDAYIKVFKPLGIKPLLGIYPDSIGSRYFLTWDQVRELSQNGWEIASHGFSHLPLTNHRFENHPDQIFNEIILSKKIIQEQIKKEVYVFIYPFGVYENSSVELVQMTRYRLAFGIKPDIIKFPLGKSLNIYTLPRFMLTRRNAKKTFDQFLLPLRYNYM